MKEMLYSQIKRPVNKSGIRQYRLLLFAMMFTLVGCFDEFEEDFYFTDFQVEFNDASYAGGNSVGRTYPLLEEVKRGSGLHTYQVNLIGGQKEAPITLEYRVVDEESTAIEGIHYQLPQSGVFIIEENSSFGEIQVEVLDFEIGSGAAILVLELVGNQEVEVAENYKRIGIPIDRRGDVEPGVLIPTIPLHEQLGAPLIFTHIAIDPMHPDLSNEFVQRWNAARTNVVETFGGRSPHNLSFFFSEDGTVEIIMGYFFSGGKAPANIIYDFEVDENGVGTFNFISANTNGNSLRSRMDDLFADYLEKEKFQVKWVDSDITTPQEGVFIGGLFDVEDPSSFLFGRVQNVADKEAPVWFTPTSPTIPTVFQDNEGQLYTSIYIDPNSSAHSEEFKNVWNDVVTRAQAELGGRILKGMALVFDPDFNAVQLVFYYTSASGSGKFIATFRNQLFIDHEGNIELSMYSGNANATVVWVNVLDPDILEYYFENFRVEAGGEGANLYRSGESTPFATGSLGNIPLETAIFFPE